MVVTPKYNKGLTVGWVMPVGHTRVQKRHERGGAKPAKSRLCNELPKRESHKPERVHARGHECCDETFTGDEHVRESLGFLMTREIAHMQMFTAALATIEPDFPPGILQGDPHATHTYFDLSDA
jgi:hypothetical protein